MLLSSSACVDESSGRYEFHAIDNTNDIKY